MITIYTKTPDELVKSLKEYFLITDHFVILSCIEEIDNHIDDWIDLYNGYVNESIHKICFNVPFLAISTDTLIINELLSTFDTLILNEINNILEDGIKFIQRGFLPLVPQLVVYYIDNVILPKLPNNQNLNIQSAVFNIFQQLGYLTINNEPTSRLINTLNESENPEYVKYANILTINTTNQLLNITSQEYKKLIFEVLKLIDYIVHVGADMVLNTTNTETNTESNTETNTESNTESNE